MCAACAPGADASRPCRQVYHSNLEDPNAEVVCGCAILPMKTTTKGPAPVIQDGAHTLHPHSHVRDSDTHPRGLSLAAPNAPGDDFIDEVLGFFKANVLFKSFQPAGSADRVLLYLTLYTTQALAKCVTCETAPVALKALTAMAHENFAIPGDAGFTLGSFYSPPSTSHEGDLCRAYLKQAREELGRRLITKVYLDGSPSKLWLARAHVHTSTTAHLGHPCAHAVGRRVLAEGCWPERTPRTPRSRCRGLGAHPARRHVPPAHPAVPIAQPRTRRSPSAGRPGASGRALASAATRGRGWRLRASRCARARPLIVSPSLNPGVCEEEVHEQELVRRRLVGGPVSMVLLPAAR